jgi:hypothetical protein
MLTRSKTDYMKCDFSATTQEEEMLDSIVMWYPIMTHLSLFEIDSSEG